MFKSRFTLVSNERKTRLSFFVVWKNDMKGGGLAYGKVKYSFWAILDVRGAFRRSRRPSNFGP